MRKRTKLWAVIEFRQVEGEEWEGAIRATYPDQASAVAARGEYLLNQPKGEEKDPDLVRVRQIVAEQEVPSIMDALAAAGTVGELRDILVKARLTLDASPATKRKWESFATLRELALNMAPASPQEPQKGVLLGGSSRLLGADGRPIQ